MSIPPSTPSEPEPTDPAAPSAPAQPSEPTDSPESSESSAPRPGAPAAQSRKGAKRTIIILLLVVVLLLAVIAGLLVYRRSAPAPQPSATATAEQGAVPSLTDAAALEVAHGEVARRPDDPRARGRADAPVVLVLYSDFACPYCTLFAQEVEPALTDLVDNGTLRIEWRDLAQITPTSPLAAQAGIAAGNQGRFWEFHDAVYAAADPNSHPEYSEESLVAFARQAGVADIERFRTDMTSDATVTAVSDATAHAHDIGVTGTPFLIINDAVINGYKPADVVRSTVLDQAVRARG